MAKTKTPRGGVFLTTMPDNELPEEYQKGWVYFCGCRIDLSARPLIPRPETEFWARKAILELAARPRQNEMRVLDIFSGSGCVGVAIAKNLPRAMVDLADIDKSAVGQIKTNLKINKIPESRARVFESDIFEKIPAVARYDAILANPPYVDPARIAEVQRSVIGYEPARALFADGGGLAVIEKFLGRARDFLKDGGFAYLEFDPLQKKRVKVIIKEQGYSSAEFFKDQFGRWRFVKIFK